MKKFPLYCALLAALAGGAALADPVHGTTTVDFSNGLAGWNGAANNAPYATIDNSANGTPAIHTEAELFFTQYWTGENPAFLGNYASFDSVTLGIDVTVAAITQLDGTPVQKDFLVELIDYDKPSSSAGFSSVWFKLGVIGGDAPGTQHFSVTFDPRSDALPAGWTGRGEYDADGNPFLLPPGQTFRRLLSDVDEVVFTTAIPGYSYTANLFDLSVDNIAIGAVSAVPEADLLMLWSAGLGMLGLVARRRPVLPRPRRR